MPTRIRSFTIGPRNALFWAMGIMAVGAAGCSDAGEAVGLADASPVAEVEAGRVDVPLDGAAPAASGIGRDGGPCEGCEVDAAKGNSDAAISGDAGSDSCGVGALPEGPSALFPGRVTAIFLVPSDQTVDPRKEAFFRCAVQYVQSWYKTKAGRSFSWSFRTMTANQSAAQLGCSGTTNDPACFSRVVQSLQSSGLPIYADQTHFAVALQGNTVTWLGARAAGPSGGGFALFGADLSQQLIDRRCTPGTCSTSFNGQTFAGDFVTGGVAHEMGHAFGLPHPDAGESGGNLSVMGYHYTFPINTFLGRELSYLATNPLLVP